MSEIDMNSEKNKLAYIKEFENLVREQSREKRQKLAQEFAAEVAKMRVSGEVLGAKLQEIRDTYRGRGMDDESKTRFTTDELDGLAKPAYERLSEKKKGELAEEYREAMAKAKGNKQSVLDVKKKFEEKGLDVDHTPLQISIADGYNKWRSE